MKKALIIIDLQNDYFKNGTIELQGIDKALIQTNKLIKYFIGFLFSALYL